MNSVSKPFSQVSTMNIKLFFRECISSKFITLCRFMSDFLNKVEESGITHRFERWRYIWDSIKFFRLLKENSRKVLPSLNLVQLAMVVANSNVQHFNSGKLESFSLIFYVYAGCIAIALAIFSPR